jgi:3D (Asp-Asp-Asp) domain-containing protein
MSFLVIALFLGNFTVTSYRAIPEQTRPHGYTWTASGERTNCHGVAVSQDMLKRNGGIFQFGDMVFIEKIGLKFINDTMHTRHKHQFDILVGTHEEEKAFDKKFRGKKLRVWLLRVPKEISK